MRLEKKATGLSRPSIANAYDLQKAIREDFEERAGQLPQNSMDELDEGLRLVLGL